jgi:hypothetical protein
MSAEILREAAKVLRELATDANDFDAENEEPWFKVPDDASIRTKWVTFAAAYDREAAYIAAMPPGVGIALADWLDLHARNLDGGFMIESGKSPAFAVARAILGGAS